MILRYHPERFNLSRPHSRQEEFQEEPGKREFIDFIKDLGKKHPDSGILDELEAILNL